MARTQGYNRSQRDRFQNPARLSLQKGKKKGKIKKPLAQVKKVEVKKWKGS